jgi:hypothetical protein
LALATHNFDKISEVIVKKFTDENITCRTVVLVPAFDGATVKELET